MSLDWVRRLRDDCQKRGTPIFIKQLGSVAARAFKLKHAKGADWDEWPSDLDDLKLREFPTPRKP